MPCCYLMLMSYLKDLERKREVLDAIQKLKHLKEPILATAKTAVGMMPYVSRQFEI